MPVAKKPTRRVVAVPHVRPESQNGVVAGDPIADLFRDNANNRESDKAKEFKAAVEALYSEISLEMKSVLTERQVIAMTRALIYAEKFQSPMMLLGVKSLLRLSISKLSAKGETGAGRFDMREVLKHMIGNRNETDAAALGKKLMGD